LPINVARPAHYSRGCSNRSAGTPGTRCTEAGAGWWPSGAEQRWRNAMTKGFYIFACSLALCGDRSGCAHVDSGISETGESKRAPRAFSKGDLARKEDIHAKDEKRSTEPRYGRAEGLREGKSD
jgi:hypothetical protein